jgi:hypothetical protein
MNGDSYREADVTALTEKKVGVRAIMKSAQKRSAKVVMDGKKRDVWHSDKLLEEDLQQFHIGLRREI